jgi:hypothetical protein
MTAVLDVPTVLWHTGADYGTAAHPLRVWVWSEYLARGTVAELDGKVKLAGKTTFCQHLARSIADGEKFLERPTLRGAVVYLTEEGGDSFEASMEANGLGGCPDFHYASKREQIGVSWEQLVESARQTIIETESVLLIVDTLGKLAGFKDDDENSAGKVMTALTPLQALAEQLNVAVLVTRHDRRAGGDVSESGRGSTAIAGDMDQILQLSRFGGNGHDSERRLKALGRIVETPEELLIELEGGAYRIVGPDDARNKAAEALLRMLRPEEAAAVTDLLPDLKKLGHSRQAVYAAVGRLTLNRQLDEIKLPGKPGPGGRARMGIVLRSFHHDQERGTTYPNGINELPESGQRREVVPRYPHPKGWERDHLHETETPDEELEAFDPADVF